MCLIIFTDLASRMVTFFKMLFSMVVDELDKRRHIFDSLSQPLRLIEKPQVNAVTVKYNTSNISKIHAVGLDYLSSILEKMIIKKEILDSTKFNLFDDSIITLLFGDGLFIFRNAISKDNTQSLIIFLGGVFQSIGTQTKVNGYTRQKQLIVGVDLNWRLSEWWTASLTSYLCGAVYQNKIMALDFVEKKYRKLLDVNTLQRMSIARLIDIIVYPTVWVDD